MLIDDTKADLSRRVKETYELTDKIEQFSLLLASTMRREAGVVKASLPALNREGRIQSNGLLHGLSAAASVLLEEWAKNRS